MHFNIRKRVDWPPNRSTKSINKSMLEPHARDQSGICQRMNMCSWTTWCDLEMILWYREVRKLSHVKRVIQHPSHSVQPQRYNSEQAVMCIPEVKSICPFKLWFCIFAFSHASSMTRPLEREISWTGGVLKAMQSVIASWHFPGYASSLAVVCIARHIHLLAFLAFLWLRLQKYRSNMDGEDTQAKALQPLLQRAEEVAKFDPKVSGIQTRSAC